MTKLKSISAVFAITIISVSGAFASDIQTPGRSTVPAPDPIVKSNDVSFEIVVLHVLRALSLL